MNKILVPVDFEAQSLIALEQSFNLARLLPAEIVLLYVYQQPSGFAGIFGSNDDNDRLYKIQEKLEELAGKVENEKGIKTSALIEKGKVYAKILEVSEKLPAGFIIMGTHSQPLTDGEVEGVLGANSSRVIRSSKCPVITINGAHHYKGCRNILLPLDLTNETRQKVTYAIELAKLFGSGIKVVSALIGKNDASSVFKLQHQLDQVFHFISDAGVNCAAEIIEEAGSDKMVVPSIISYAEKQGDIDLIVIMTQQEPGIIEYFVGSHAQEFIRLSTIPVMSIVPKQLGFTSIFS
jgi:nucleotide-binding universal stress UspA family protein